MELSRFVLVLLVLLVGCNSPIILKSPEVVTTVVATSQKTLQVTPTVTTPQMPLRVTPTEDPLYFFSYEYLTIRTYGEGEIKLINEMGGGNNFTRYTISYPSDGLTIYGFMDVPKAPGLYLVVIALHGHVNADIYQTLDYTTRYADNIASNGYVVIHPNMRNYKPSDNGPSNYYVGYAIDVLNLIGMVRKQGNLVGLLKKADPERIGLWGHSMGGGVAIRVLTIDPKIRAAVLYAAVSGDLTVSRNRFGSLGGSDISPALLSASTADIVRISPSSFYHNIQAAVSIHHGENDSTVPLQWSKDLCNQLTQMGKTVECFYYPGQVHTFQGDGEQLFEHRVVDFFSRTLR
jgi:dipeptidyl aminopeptidase/acylaminoacyl peptidase